MKKPQKKINDLKKLEIKKTKLSSISGGTSSTRMTETGICEVEYVDTNNNGTQDSDECSFEIDMPGC